MELDREKAAAFAALKKMVQQAYVAAAAASEWPQQQQQLQLQMQHQQQLQVAPSEIQTIAASMPAIVVGNQTASQYSPQDSNNSAGSVNQNYYQQQLIKSAQQQFVQHQRMNGTNSVAEGLYNGVSSGATRPAPIYAPKPTYYRQQQQQQQQPLYQQTRAFYATQQQQHSPASMMQQQQPSSIPSVLSVRQLPAAGSMQQQQVMANGTATTMLSQQNSPQSNPHLSATAIAVATGQQVQSPEQQQQQQMQHLIMSYSHQQQQQQPFTQIQQQHEVIMQPQMQNYATNSYNVANTVQHQGENLQQHQQHDARRSQMEEQHRLIQQQHLRNSAAALSRAGRMSDRDSVSTLSRFNQFDDQRSFTMRSQYTSANNAAKYSRRFGFLELSCEALKRILGFASNTKPPNRLLSPVVGVDGSEQRKNSGSHVNSSAKITSIDSGEDYYFKRKVFKYQLVILRVISFLCAAFVLLSPVAMLLIPKLEFILHNQAEFGQAGGTDISPKGSLSATGALESATGTGPSQSTPSVTVVTHGVGLSATNKHHQNQVNYFIPQPQWRISECSSDCDGPFIGFFAKFIMLCFAYWAIFFRSQTSSLPRIDFHRCLLISMAALLTLAYWMFFTFRVFDKRFNDFELQYMTIVQFALSMLDSLILLHYLAVLLLELRERKKIYCLKVVRSPDGASQYLSCGSLSIQKCAQYVLEKYHREFNNFSPYREHLLELEDELAKNLSSSATRDRGGEKSPLHGRSRPSSPANSTTHGRSSRHHSHHQSTRQSRHHSRGNSTQHRSPSRSPIRSSRGGHSRSRRKQLAEAQQKNVDQQQQNSSSKSQVKLYQVDLNPPTTAAASSSQAKDQETLDTPSTTGANPNQNNNISQERAADSIKDSNGENDSADQSSDATSRMKESSIETIRAANSTSELLSSQQQQQLPSKAASAKQRSSSKARHGGADLEQSSSAAQQQQRDETESVRSVRSRRSTSRSQHRHREHHHHHHNRERSSSQADERDHHEQHSSAGHDSRRRGNAVSIPMNSADDPLAEHERKLRRRKYRLLLAVQDTFEQIRQIDEGKSSCLI